MSDKKVEGTIEDLNVNYTLKKPIVYEDVEYKELFLDFESLTGRDLEEAAREVPTQGRGVVIEMDKPYQAAIASRAAGVPLEVIKALSAKDYTQVTVEVANFLMF